MTQTSTKSPMTSTFPVTASSLPFSAPAVASQSLPGAMSSAPSTPLPQRALIPDKSTFKEDNNKNDNKNDNNTNSNPNPNNCDDGKLIINNSTRLAAAEPRGGGGGDELAEGAAAQQESSELRWRAPNNSQSNSSSSANTIIPQNVNTNNNNNNSTNNNNNINTNNGFGSHEDEDDEKHPKKMLQQWSDMPRHLQFNPYVLTGYRPLQSLHGCLSSLFYMHNETINILTHGIPIVYILATVPATLMWDDDFHFLSWCHILGSVAPWCGSFVYHLFMNLDRGESVYYTLLKLDMLGIWISQSFGALPMVTATVHCLNWHLKWFIILTYSILSLWGLYKAMCALSPWQRRLCFLLPFMMRILLQLLRLTRFGGGNPASLTHVFLQDAVSVVGGAIGAMHIPEKWFPGCMDYYLNSHNIMHILVVMAVYSMHQATIQDFDWMSSTECSLSANGTIITSSSTASILDPMLMTSSNAEL